MRSAVFSEDQLSPSGRLLWIAAAAIALMVAASPRAQEATLPVPANVTLDGVPPIPLSLVDAVAPYGRFRQARMVAWHPTERRLLIATAFANATQLHQVRFPGGARTQLTFFPDGVGPRPGAVFGAASHASSAERRAPSAGQDYIVFEKDTAGGGEANQLFRFDVATGALVMLTDGTSRNGSPVISRRGLVAYDSTRRDGKNRDLYVVKPMDPASTRLLAQGDGQWNALDWSADESAILAQHVVSSSESSIWRITVADGQKTLLTPKRDRPVRWTSAAFAPDGTSVYAMANLDGEHARVWRLDAGTWAPVTRDDQVVHGFALSPDGQVLAVVVDLGTTTRLDFVDASGRLLRSPTLPPGVISDLVWHPVRPEVAFSLAGARTFNDVYSADAKTGAVERWTASEIGGALPETLPDAEIVRWKSFDGLEITGNLYRPPARFAGPRPVIINVHGGPVAREWPRAIGRSNYFRNELGIAVIYPNVRGSSGFGRTFEELDNGRLRENAVKDIGALLDWIAAEPLLDERRVMIAGASYGGYVTLAAAVAYGDRLRGANPAFGITDFPSFLESTEISRQANRNAEYGDPSDPEMRAFLTRISPLTNVARIKIPVFVAAGAKDTRVPIGQAETMVKALKSNGTPVWYVRFEDAGHLQLSPATADFSIYTWVMFVKAHLLN